MSAKALAIYLDAPLQSWGVASQFQLRDTESHPSKSAILGLVAAALGIDKYAADEETHLKELNALRFFTVSLSGLSKDRVTRLADFHTIGGGYDKKDPLEAGHIPRKASGGAFGTVITRRTYLNDAKFVAILDGEASLLSKVARAIENPNWGIWLGRKCCLPAMPLLPTLADTPKQAFITLVQRVLPEVDMMTLLESAAQVEEDSGDVAHWRDQPISFGQRRFQSRPVRRDAKL